MSQEGVALGEVLAAARTCRPPLGGATRCGGQPVLNPTIQEPQGARGPQQQVTFCDCSKMHIT